MSPRHSLESSRIVTNHHSPQRNRFQTRRRTFLLLPLSILITTSFLFYPSENSLRQEWSTQKPFEDWQQKVDSWKQKGKGVWSDWLGGGKDWWNGNHGLASGGGDLTVEEEIEIELEVEDYNNQLPSSPSSPPLQDPSNPLSKDPLSSHSSSPDTPYPVSLSPISRSLSSTSSQKYISYLPHSGFHNQRIEFQNALTLASYLNRTLLLPPIWVGAAPSGGGYEYLKSRWEDFLSQYTRSAVDAPGGWVQPTEITGLDGKTKKIKPSTMMSWDYLFDLEFLRPDYEVGVEEGGWDGRVELGNRWKGKSGSDELVHGMTEEGVKWEILGGEERIDDQEVYILADQDRYDFQFTDILPSPDQTSTLIIPTIPGESKYLSSVSLPALDLVPHKLLLLGSLFGSNRIALSKPKRRPLKKYVRAPGYFANYFWFREPLTLEASVRMVDLLGWGHFSAHARVGDGVFEQKAEAKMKELFGRLVNKIGHWGREKEEREGWWKVGMTDKDVEKEMWEAGKERLNGLVKGLVKEKGRMVKRGEGEREQLSGGWESWDGEDEDELQFADLDEEDSHLLNFQSSSSLNRRALPTSPKPYAKPVTALSPFLQCHSPLHTSPHLLPFNTPFYLATDSRSPSTDPHLSIFFSTFPCIFTFSTFSSLEPTVELGIGKVKRMVNEVDGVGLGGFMIPVLEAEVAARAKVVAVTEGSTFGGYVERYLWPVYKKEAEEAEGRMGGEWERL